MDRTGEELAVRGSRTLPKEIGDEHPVGAGYDDKGHRDSSLPHPQEPRRRSLRWVVSITIALLAAALLIGWMTWAAPG